MSSKIVGFMLPISGRSTSKNLHTSMVLIAMLVQLLCKHSFALASSEQDMPALLVIHIDVVICPVFYNRVVLVLLEKLLRSRKSH